MENARLILTSVLITLVALGLLGLHMVCPARQIDNVAVALLVVAIIPWLGPLFKTIEVPGLGKVEFKEIKEQLAQTQVYFTASDSYTLGELYRLQKKWEDARSAFEEAVKRDPKFAYGFYGHALTDRDEARDIKARTGGKEPLPGRYQELLRSAREQVENALSIDNRYAAAYLARATIEHEQSENPELIRKDVMTALRLDKNLEPWVREEGLETFIDTAAL